MMRYDVSLILVIAVIAQRSALNFDQTCSSTKFDPDVRPLKVPIDYQMDLFQWRPLVPRVENGVCYK